MNTLQNQRAILRDCLMRTAADVMTAYHPDGRLAVYIGPGGLAFPWTGIGADLGLYTTWREYNPGTTREPRTAAQVLAEVADPSVFEHICTEAEAIRRIAMRKP